MFITFRLKDSLPANLSNGKEFLALDRLLDHPHTGPLHLGIPEIAAGVVQALRDGQRRLRSYRLHSFAVMPNHVHLLVTSETAAARWLGPLKDYTAYLANRILRRGGQPFWQEESYDHLVRDDREFCRLQRYIEDNPVKAGLVSAAEEYPWSSRGSPL